MQSDVDALKARVLALEHRPPTIAQDVWEVLKPWTPLLVIMVLNRLLHPT